MKKYKCKCFVKNSQDKIEPRIGEVYISNNLFFEIDYLSTTGFYVSKFTLPIDDIHDYNIYEKNRLEVICSSGAMTHVDAYSKKIENRLYKFSIYLSKSEELYKDIRKCKEKRLEERKKYLKKRIEQKTKRFISNTNNYIKIKGFYGRSFPKKINYNGFTYEGAYDDLVIEFDNESEEKYLGQQIKNDYSNTSIYINFKDINDYYIKSQKIYIKIYEDINNQDENLLYFGYLIEKNNFIIILECEDIEQLYNLLSKKVNIRKNKKEIEYKEKENRRCPKKYKPKSSYPHPIFVLLYFIFYPLIYFISIPFMIISMFRKDKRSEEEKALDDLIYHP